VLEKEIEVSPPRYRVSADAVAFRPAAVSVKAQYEEFGAAR
jgi:hypothetical protein